MLVGKPQEGDAKGSLVGEGRKHRAATWFIISSITTLLLRHFTHYSLLLRLPRGLPKFSRDVGIRLPRQTIISLAYVCHV